MRSLSLMGLSAGLWLASFGAGMAQSVATGLEVRVNLNAARSSDPLLYPGGEYSRTVPQLLYPGQRSGAVTLYPPGTRRVVRRAPRPVQMASAPPPAPEQPVAKPAPAPKPAAPAPQVAGPNPFNPPNYSNIFGGQTAKPAPAQPAKPAPAQTVKPAPSAPSSDTGLTKRSVILFAKDASDPAEGALGAIKFLAADLNAAMTRPSSRVELQAFGGGKGDKGSDARRLSLRRALAIRQVLINDGVSPDRIDVRAMGGAEDSGPADRVDVYVRA